VTIMPSTSCRAFSTEGDNVCVRLQRYNQLLVELTSLLQAWGWLLSWCLPLRYASGSCEVLTCSLAPGSLQSC
jgi:hypothetical protein